MNKIETVLKQGLEKICDFDFEGKLWSDEGFDEFKQSIKAHQKDLLDAVVAEVRGKKGMNGGLKSKDETLDDIETLINNSTGV